MKVLRFLCNNNIIIVTSTFVYNKLVNSGHVAGLPTILDCPEFRLKTHRSYRTKIMIALQNCICDVNFPEQLILLLNNKGICCGRK